MEKRWYHSKTIWFNLTMAALLGIEASFSYFQGLFDQQVYAILATVLAVGNGILRVISTAKLIK
jgi:hypothetical protein